MNVIFGLGNPGEKYQHTRHNAGFWYADMLADKHHGSFKTEKKIQSRSGHPQYSWTQGFSGETTNLYELFRANRNPVCQLLPH